MSPNFIGFDKLFDKPLCLGLGLDVFEFLANSFLGKISLFPIFIVFNLYPQDQVTIFNDKFHI